jgi:ketosteroid isomerase-like protein
MTLTLPQTIATYVEAKNRHDTAAMLAPFAPDAIVYDDGGTYRGTAAIAGWIAQTTSEYRVTLTVTGLTQGGREVAMTTLVSGDFAGSPAPFTYLFTLTDDGADGQIAALTIRYDG